MTASTRLSSVIPMFAWPSFSRPSIAGHGFLSGSSPSAVNTCSRFVICCRVSSAWCESCCFSSGLCAASSSWPSMSRTVCSMVSAAPSLNVNSCFGVSISTLSNMTPSSSRRTPHLASPVPAPQNGPRIALRIPRPSDVRRPALGDAPARMPAALPSRRVLLLAAGVIYAAAFTAMLLVEVPGLGLGHFMYVAIALVALAAGPVEGVAAGVGAASLYSLAIVLNPQVPSREVATAGSGIRLITFTIVGLLLGWFSRQNRTLVRELQILADRDGLTGLPNTRSFEVAITRRFESERPFALLIGDMDGLQRLGASSVLEGDDAVRRLAEVLGKCLGPEDELARVGGDEFAVLT